MDGLYTRRRRRRKYRNPNRPVRHTFPISTYFLSLALPLAHFELPTLNVLIRCNQSLRYICYELPK